MTAEQARELADRLPDGWITETLRREADRMDAGHDSPIMRVDWAGYERHA